ncbi:MFS transporter small subunit [Mycobacterium sherrisii]
MTALRVVSWVWVGVPFCYGLYQLLVKIPALFLN